MHFLIFLFSLYLTKVGIEGDFVIDSISKAKFVESFSKRNVKLNNVIDSLFKIYEETGFFNVKFDISLDSLSGDTAILKITPIFPRLPIIKKVKTAGIGLPEKTIHTYFPFVDGIFQRSIMLKSFSVLLNANIISHAEYFFIPLSEDNTYALLVKLLPFREAFYANLTGNTNRDISGILSFTHPSILSTGIGLNVSAGLSGGNLTYYSVQNSILIPYIRGLMVNTRTMHIQDTSTMQFLKLEMSYWGANEGITIGAGKSNGNFFSSMGVWSYGKNWRGGLNIRKNKGWIFIYILTLKDVLNVKIEQAIVLSNALHYFILNKPLRASQIPVPSGKLFISTIISSSVPLKKKLFLFTDWGILGQRYFLDAGISYINGHYNIYLGYSMDKNVKEVNVGFILGLKNTVFERSIRIL